MNTFEIITLLMFATSFNYLMGTIGAQDKVANCLHSCALILSLIMGIIAITLRFANQ
jgi:hypothetical protein